MITCPNLSCKTVNPEGAEVCQVCQSALPHRYLWGVGDFASALKPGDLFNQRYLLKRDRIFLDTQPGLVPESPPELPGFLMPYLHLSAYPLHMPRPYAVLPSPAQGSVQDYSLLLESSALAVAVASNEVPTLLPTLSARWESAPPLRQLSWLHQVAQLWDAFHAEQVAATLLDDDCLRVDGSVLRLLALSSPSIGQRTVEAITQRSALPQPTLADLSRSWQPLVETSHQAVRAFLDRLCEQVDRKQLNAEQLSEQLSQAISVCGQGQAVSYDLAVYTDQGPTRKRNEDACYPQSGTTLTLTSDQTKAVPQLLIVCDGIGGHQGGDVASKLAIATIESRLRPLIAQDSPDITATELSLAIEAAICAANDEISAQNDQAQRQARDRMGTTLVLALVKGADIYVAHLGDSRAYRISQRNCQQVTLDDDVACRQVRLGGGLYREVLTQSGSGSLIQALGMSSSQTLRPTVQRFVLDENCVFLLCSDGLSDSDRVEQFWQQVLQPLVLEDRLAERSTADVGKHLVDLANKHNGHDNVTVGLITAQVIRPSERMVPRDLASYLAKEVAGTTALGGVDSSSAASAGRANRGTTKIVSIPSDDASAGSTASIGNQTVSDPSQSKPAVSQSNNGKPNNGLKLGAVIALIAALCGAIYLLFPGLLWRFTSPTASEEDSAAQVDASPDAVVPDERLPARAAADIQVGGYLRVVPNFAASGSTAEGEDDVLRLYPKPQISSNELAVTVPTGGIALVMQQSEVEKTQWVQIMLCSIPSGDTLSDVPAETDSPPADTGSTPSGLNDPAVLGSKRPIPLDAGNEAWVLRSAIANASETIQDLEPTQLGSCDS